MPKALLFHATDPDLQLAEQPAMPFPVLGVTTIAALFPAQWEVSVIDEDVDPVDTSQKADLVGISTLTLDAPHAYKLADGFRQREVPVLMGGMHPSVLPDEALEHCDGVVVGKAEGIFQKVLDDFLKDIMRGIYRGDKWTSQQSPLRGLICYGVPTERYFNLSRLPADALTTANSVQSRLSSDTDIASARFQRSSPTLEQCWTSHPRT